MPSRVELRDIESEDLAVLYEHQRQPDANQMAAFPARDRTSFMTHWQRVLDDESVAKKAILFGGALAGYIVSFEQNGKLLVGYWIGQQFWGKGIGTMALAQFLGVVETRPLYAHVAKHNQGSIRVLQKCGFTLYAEGTASDATDGVEIEELTFRLE